MEKINAYTYVGIHTSVHFPILLFIARMPQASLHFHPAHAEMHFRNSTYSPVSLSEENNFIRIFYKWGGFSIHNNALQIYAF